MIKKKVLALDKRGESKASTHVIIERDTTPPNPLKDYDQVFLLHSNIRSLSGNEDDGDYDSPLEEIVDEDGYGTGEYRFREGVVHFPVSAYIHSGIALRMGSIREFPCDPGGWDTTRNAAYMWTDRERFEEMCGPWMEVYSIDDIDFPEDEDTDVFDATGRFVGDEWTLPELVVKSPISGLYLMTEGSEGSDAEWVGDLAKAKVFHHWNCAYNAFLQRGKRLWSLPEYAKNHGHDTIKDKDELK